MYFNLFYKLVSLLYKINDLISLKRKLTLIDLQPGFYVKKSEKRMNVFKILVAYLYK